MNVLIIASNSLRRAQLRLTYENRPGFIVVGELEHPKQLAVGPRVPTNLIVYESELDGEVKLDYLLFSADT